MKWWDDFDDDDTTPIKVTLPVKIGLILLAFVIVPLAFGRCLCHCLRPGHRYRLTCVNFRFGIECTCGRVFINE